MGGRIACGMIADRLGAKPTLLVGLALQAVMVFSYLFTRDTLSFYAAAVLFGISYGGVMPLYALVTREYFGEKVMGSAYGAVFLISTLGMGLGAWAGGFIHDAFGTYAWLFISSAAIGLMAMVLALTFRAPRVVSVAHPAAAGAR
jgi:MFS family permease